MTGREFDVFDHLNLAALRLLSQVPNPGRGQAPPGADNLLTILRWAAYLGYAVCVLGVIVAAATMAIQHRHGTAGENGARLGWVLAGSLLIGSASALVNGVT